MPCEGRRKPAVESLARAKHKPSGFVPGHFWRAAPGSFFVSAEDQPNERLDLVVVDPILNPVSTSTRPRSAMAWEVLRAIA